jgi:hypothetical protein
MGCKRALISIFALNVQRVWARHNRSRRSDGTDIPHHLPYHVYHHNHHCRGVYPNLPPHICHSNPGWATSRKHWRADQAAPFTSHKSPLSKNSLNLGPLVNPGALRWHVRHHSFDSRPSNQTRAISRSGHRFDCCFCPSPPPAGFPVHSSGLSQFPGHDRVQLKLPGRRYKCKLSAEGIRHEDDVCACTVPPSL